MNKMGLDTFFHRNSYTEFTEKDKSGALWCLFQQSFQKHPPFLHATGMAGWGE